MKYLTKEEAIEINKQIILDYSPKEIIGVKYPFLLDSAIARPQQTVFGVDAYPSLSNKAAALFESLGQNHPFQSGNKRTAFSCMYYFLYENGYMLKMDQEEAEEFTVDMVKHKYDILEVSEIIEQNSVTL